MTDKVKVGLVGTGKIGQIYAKNISFCLPVFELTTILGLFVDTAKKHRVDYPIPTLYKDDHPCFADNSLKTASVYLLTNSHAQLIKKPGSTNSTSFPPFYCWEQEVTPAPNIILM